MYQFYWHIFLINNIHAFGRNAIDSIAIFSQSRAKFYARVTKVIFLHIMRKIHLYASLLVCKVAFCTVSAKLIFTHSNNQQYNKNERIKNQFFTMRKDVLYALRIH